MAPKTNCNPIKLASIVVYLQNSRSCHTLKDLEKQLPAAASISGMQVKDYLQALQDENKIRVEKIGSGNWYWSFASEEQSQKEKAYQLAKSGYEKAEAAVNELRDKIAEAAAQREEEEDMFESGRDTREDLVAKQAVVEAELKALQKELESYRDNDPTEIQRKAEETAKLKGEAEKYEEQIDSMKYWFKGNAPDGVNIVEMECESYPGVWDPDDRQWRELE